MTMISPFDFALNRTVGAEGDFSNEKNDRGGPTKYGITQAVAIANGWTDDVKDLPWANACVIYKSQYWDTFRGDELAKISSPIAAEIFDTGVNCGVGTAVAFLQRALNAFNKQGTIYPDLKPDGIIGPMTIFALKAYLASRPVNGQEVLLKTLNGLQIARYIDIVEKDRTQEDFVYGWIKERA